MEGKTFAFEVVTPERVVFTGAVTTAVAPAAYGYLGILANHAPLLVTLAPGNITCRSAGGMLTTLRCEGGGFLEVRDNRVVALADRCRLVHQVAA